MDNPHKSSNARVETSAGGSAKKFPVYGIIGFSIIVLAEIGLFSGVEWVGQWFTPIVWTGYILFVDGIIRRRKGNSLLSTHPREFAILAVISFASWEIFEGYNLLVKNWRYINMIENTPARFFGYFWAYATISPCMFLTYELLDDILPGKNRVHSPRLGNSLFYPFVVFGFVCMIVPLIWPSTYMAPIIWIGWAFFLDPINQRLGERSFISELFSGLPRSTAVFFLAGVICGLLWEFWNYWAISKWQYDVPYLGHIKLFEMPVLGFLGFLPFTIESYAIYVFIRRLLPIKRRVRYLG